MEDRYLKNIKQPSDLGYLSDAELEALAGEIRGVLIDTVPHTGGHLASNLGVVELTIALHRVFKSPRDKIIWDVGHQIYVHKLLTGRYKDFRTLRSQGGLSGFARPTESEHDIFFSGHSSTSISSAFGIAAANAINDDRSYTVAVIGDGAMTGGLAYEALNNVGHADKSRLIIVLNDNAMSISENVGSVARYLAVMRSKPGYFKMKALTERIINKIPIVGKSISSTLFKSKTRLKNLIYRSNFFEDMGLRYMGPIDGHNIRQVCEALEGAKLVGKPVLLHINTVKGKGYNPAEKSPSRYHGLSRQDNSPNEPCANGSCYSEEFGTFLCQQASKDKRICAITAAMSLGTGLKRFSQDYPDRFFDVGIAEEHAIPFALGLSAGSMLPVFVVYSTFLQRCYDQIFHDAALQGRKIVIAIDRAGFVGEDGETHQGLYDVALLNGIPDISVYSPATYGELRNCFVRAFYHVGGVVAVRYARGAEFRIPEDFTPSYGDFDVYGDPDADTAIVTYGRIFSFAAQARNALLQEGKSIKVIKLNAVKPMPSGAVEAALGCKRVFFFEEGIRSGGMGEHFALLLSERAYEGEYILKAVPDCFVAQGSVSEQLARYGLDTDGMIKTLKGENPGNE
ncbi:MAG: 1-deoxy-D-xylulose-5-phosphate synthase [Clostridiales bacterium]|nr:1-deoxy-D-xylulose-5-phosphate synthase [Clostridiales bacterium]